MNIAKKVLLVLPYIDGVFDKSEYNEKLKPLISKFNADYIICVDGGYIKAIEFGIKPNLIIGDMDSIRLKEEYDINFDRVGLEVIKLPVEKDETDLQISIEKAIDLGCKDLLILGGMGGRLDHTVGNLSHISKYSGDFNEIAMVDGINYATVQLAGKRKYSCEFGKHFSVFSLSEVSKGITYTGAYYSLKNGELFREVPLGVSNSFLYDEIEIEFSEGKLLIVISNGR